MAGIWELENLGDIEQSFKDAFEEAVDRLSAEAEGERGDLLRRFKIERIFIDGDWGNGTATFGQTPLTSFIVFSISGVDNESLNPSYDIIARNITINMEGLMAEGIIEVPDELIKATTEIDLRPAPADKLPDAVNLALSVQEGKRVDVRERKVFDLTRAEAIERREDVDFRSLPRIPLESLRDTGDVEDDEETPEEEAEQGTEEEEGDVEPEEVKSRSEILAEEFPDIPPHLRPYVHSNGRVEIPIGKKDTKTVEPREPYDFEIIQATARPSPRGITFSADAAISGGVMPGIGQAVRSGNFGHSVVQANQMAPSTFPRTSVYIRNHLKFEGPSYALGMFNDLLSYLALVNEIYSFDLRVGTYQSFREFIYVLREIAERGGPELISPLSQQQASSHGLETLPDHPTLEGEKAPWLERRQYYTLIEENEDHEAWRNPYEYLHEEMEQE